MSTCTCALSSTRSWTPNERIDIRHHIVFDLQGDNAQISLFHFLIVLKARAGNVRQQYCVPGRALGEQRVFHKGN